MILLSMIFVITPISYLFPVNCHILMTDLVTTTGYDMLASAKKARDACTSAENSIEEIKKTTENKLHELCNAD